MVLHRRSLSHLLLFSILIFEAIFWSSNLSAQMPLEMDWCLSDGGGIELRNGRIVGVNLAEIDDHSEKSDLFELHNLEYLRLSHEALHSLGARTIANAFSNLDEVSVHNLSLDQKSTVTLAEYYELLTLPQLKTLKIKVLDLSDTGSTITPLPGSPIKNLDVVIHLQSRLSHLIDGLHLTELRLQLLKKSRSLNVDDLDVINKQVALESFSFVGSADVRNTKIDFSKLEGLSRIKELSLCNVDFDPAELKRFPQLKILKIRRCEFESSSFESLFQLPSLTKVSIKECSNNDLGLSTPLRPVVSKLKQIDLELTPLSDLEAFTNVDCDFQVTFGNMPEKRFYERFHLSSIRHITRQLNEPELNQLLKLKNLSEVQFSGMNITTTESTMLRIASKASLRSLKVINADIEDSTWKSRGIPSVSHLQHISLITYPGPTTRLINELLNPNLLSLSISSNRYRRNRPENRWQGMKVTPLPKLQALYLEDFSFPRDKAYLPAQFLPKSLKHISLNECRLDADILTRVLNHASHLEQFQMVMGHFSEDVDLSILNNSTHLKSANLFDCDVSSEVAFNLKAKHVRVGGAEMFSW